MAKVGSLVLPLRTTVLVGPAEFFWAGLRLCFLLEGGGQSDVEAGVDGETAGQGFAGGAGVGVG